MSVEQDVSAAEPVSAPEGGLGALLRRLLWEEESGQAMVEFVIIFPVQYLIIAGIIQLSLLNLAHVVVNHAAFRASRAYLTSDESSGGMGGSSALEKAEHAAAITCAPLSGSSGVSPKPDLTYPGARGTTTLPNSGGSSAKTKVSINFKEDEHMIYCVVEHQYELIVPVVRLIFKDSDNAGLPSQFPHARVKEACVMPCPWLRKPEGGAGGRP